MEQEFDREIEAGDIADFLEKGLLESLVILFRSEPALYRHLPALLTDGKINIRLGTSALVESLAEEDSKGRNRSAREILPLLGHDSPIVRGDAAYLLGTVGWADHGAALRPLLDDENNDVREAAEEALALVSSRSRPKPG